MKTEEELVHENAIEDIFDLLQTAFTRSEVNAALQAHKAHLERWPEDRKLDLAHKFHYARESLQERELLGKELGLSPQEFDYRENLMRRIPNNHKLTAGTVGLVPQQELEEVQKLREDRMAVMRKWLKRYPADLHVASRLSDYERERAFEQDLYQQFQQALREEEAAKRAAHK